MGGKGDDKSPSEVNMSDKDGLLLRLGAPLVSIGEKGLEEPKPRFLKSLAGLLEPTPKVSSKFKSGGDAVFTSCGWERLVLLLSNLSGSSLNGECVLDDGVFELGAAKLSGVGVDFGG